MSPRASAPRHEAQHPDWFERGLDLFNDGQFFECHEAWEEIWKRSHGDEKLFLQGLIQAAVAILHAQRGNRAGARTLHLKARAKLDARPAEHMGIALGELRDALERFFDVVLTDECVSVPAPPLIRRIPKVQNR